MPKKRTLIYFIQQQPDGPIKVGLSKDPWSRCEQLQIGNPAPIKVIGVAWGGADLEADIHRSFSHLKIRGEWFKPSDKLHELIERVSVFQGSDLDWNIFVEWWGLSVR